MTQIPSNRSTALIKVLTYQFVSIITLRYLYISMLNQRKRINSIATNHVYARFLKSNLIRVKHTPFFVYSIFSFTSDPWFTLSLKMNQRNQAVFESMKKGNINQLINFRIKQIMFLHLKNGFLTSLYASLFYIVRLFTSKIKNL